MAAGALVWASDVLLDELFQDVFSLAEEKTNVAECDQPLRREQTANRMLTHPWLSASSVLVSPRCGTAAG